MTRVLMGDFGAIHRLGFQDILRGDDFDLVDAVGMDVLSGLVELFPDVIVLDLDQEETPQLVEQIVHLFPAVRVVACSSEHPMMRIFPPMHYGESYISDLDPILLARAIRG
jgi:AmiR/NasT family two-component response regulator